MESSPELLVVMPAYNEEASVRKVVLEFFREIENWTENFVFLCLNDGSRDRTGAILDRLREQLGSRLEVRHGANQGHGQTCLEGYREAARKISIGDLTNLIAELMELKTRIQVETQRVRSEGSEVERLVADASKPKKLLGWEPKYACREGLKKGLLKTIEWFRKAENPRFYVNDEYTI